MHSAEVDGANQPAPPWLKSAKIHAKSGVSAIRVAPAGLHLSLYAGKPWLDRLPARECWAIRGRGP